MEIVVKEYEYYLLPPANFAKEIARLKESLREERAQHMYTIAEFRNYRRWTESNGSNHLLKGKNENILQLLKIVDDLEKALQLKSSGEQSLVDSVQIIQQKLVAFLNSQSDEPIQKNVYDLY